MRDASLELNRESSRPDIEGFLTRLNGETPRSRILLESDLLEQLLRIAILGRLATNSSSKELFGEDYSSGLVILSKYAHALGLIGTMECTALKKFAKARNIIAHSWKADFNDEALQQLADSIQLISIKGEEKLEKPQRCFSRLDYLGVFLTEIFFNRFSGMQKTMYEGGTFLTKLQVDPTDGSRNIRTGNDI